MVSKPKKAHAATDALSQTASRKPPTQNSRLDCQRHTLLCQTCLASQCPSVFTSEINVQRPVYNQTPSLAHKTLPFTLIGGLLHLCGINKFDRRVLQPLEDELILKDMHSRVAGGHFSQDITSQKILAAS